jgi:hypothetical protein
MVINVTKMVNFVVWALLPSLHIIAYDYWHHVWAGGRMGGVVAYLQWRKEVNNEEYTNAAQLTSADVCVIQVSLHSVMVSDKCVTQTELLFID